MGKMGITAELNRRGIEPGQSVVVGKPAIGKIEY